MSTGIADAIARRSVVVCVGCGGVGKTTIAAAIALAAAQRGRRVLVLTIDPARRLADALGVGALGNEPTAIPRTKLDALGVPSNASLHAAMLDKKRTFDDLVTRLADDRTTRTRILENPVYQHVSNALAGSVEYTAMDRVYELSKSDAFDLLVLDTPPAQNALDFLEAPRRMLDFLDSRVVQLLIRPAASAGRFGLRLFERATQRVLNIVEHITGMDFVSDLSEFLLAFDTLSDGFRARAKSVGALLEGPEAAFVLVTGPERESVVQAQQFLAKLDDFQVPLVGLIANRVRSWPERGPLPELDASMPDIASLGAALARPGESEARVAQAALDAAARYAALVRRDERTLEGLRCQIERERRDWRVVRELPNDVHDLEALSLVGQALARPSTETRT